MDQIMQLFTMLFVVIGIETIIIYLVFFRTPAGTFLKAALAKQSIMYIIGKDRVGEFKAFKPKNGSAEISGHGIFGLSENSNTLELGAKIPIYFAFRDTGATMPAIYPAIIQEMRKRPGIILNTIDDLQNLLNKIKQGKLKPLPVEIKPFLTFPVHELENMFPFNIDPSYIESLVQSKHALALKRMNQLPLQIGGIIIFMVAAAVAVLIINMAFKKSIGVEDCQMMVEAAKCGLNGIGAAVNTSPIV